MSYFKNFPLISYDFSSKADVAKITAVITDLSTKINLVISNSDLENLCFRYVVKNTELPENISQTFYNTPELSWTIMYINGIANLNNEWPLSDLELLNYVSNIYGTSNIYSVHHYEKLPENIQMDQQFIIANYGSSLLNTVTNIDYETRLNEYKRLLYIIRPEYINDFVKSYNAGLL